ncbi:MAG: hypothetical protein LBK07_11060 [Tannerella sp.]|jgi:hypothetical protein|nr:hypothetical protein [Tannerella sp.]
MQFWRNNHTATFDPDSAGQLRIAEALRGMEPEYSEHGVRAVRIFLAVMLRYLEEKARLPQTPDRLLMQEFSTGGKRADIRVVINGMERRILGTVTGGGFRLLIDFSEGYRAELSLYYHRLVCTNGMIREIRTGGTFHAFSLEEWQSQIEDGLPRAMSGIPVTMESFYRSAQVRLGFLAPMLPVILDCLEVAEPFRGMISDSFGEEPGDTLWHFVNAFSRAANLVMLAHGIPADEARRKRLQLQKASVEICENMLDGFTQGKGIFELAETMKKSFSS